MLNAPQQTAVRNAVHLAGEARRREDKCCAAQHSYLSELNVSAIHLITARSFTNFAGRPSTNPGDTWESTPAVKNEQSNNFQIHNAP